MIQPLHVERNYADRWHRVAVFVGVLLIECRDTGLWINDDAGLSMRGLQLAEEGWLRGAKCLPR